MTQALGKTFENKTTQGKFNLVQKALGKDQMNIEDLKNIYKGRTALIISGGPGREKWKKIC